MSVAGSSQRAAEAPLQPFVESDQEETTLGYGDGGVPFYIAVVWGVYIVVYVLVMLTLALPDFRAWAGF